MMMLPGLFHVTDSTLPNHLPEDKAAEPSWLCLNSQYAQITADCLLLLTLLSLNASPPTFPEEYLVHEAVRSPHQLGLLLS